MCAYPMVFPSGTPAGSKPGVLSPQRVRGSYDVRPTLGLKIGRFNTSKGYRARGIQTVLEAHLGQAAIKSDLRDALDRVELRADPGPRTN